MIQEKSVKTAAAYIRVSTEDQMEFSPDSQLKKIQEYAARHHLTLPKQQIYLDEGISGRSAAKRPAFMKMIAMAKEKPRPFDVILLWKFSRFARNRQDSILYKSMLRRECGIDVISITEQLSDDPTSMLIEALLEAMDEYYSINLAQEVRRGMNEKFSRGGVVSIPPFGYRMGKEHFEIDLYQASLVTMIYQDFLKGLSCRQIAGKLNEMGILSNRGNPFESRTVEYILSNPTYCGKLRRNLQGTDRTDRFHRSENVMIVNGFHKAIISEELYDSVQKKMALTQRSYAAYSRTSPDNFMLQGLVRCSNCGATLTRTSGKHSLQCYRYARGQCEKSHSVTLKNIKSALFRQIEQDFQEAALYIRFLPPSEETDTQTIRLLLKREQERLQKVKAAYEAGIDSIKEYQQSKRKILKQIEELSLLLDSKKTPPKHHPKTLTITIPQLLSLLDSPAIDECDKNKLLRSFISKIIFNRTDSTLQIYYHT